LTQELFSSLQIHLDDEGLLSLTKLARWSKILGSINFFLGTLNGLMIIPIIFNDQKMIVIAILPLLISGVLIYMGIELNKASRNIHVAIINERDDKLSDALINIQKFFFLSVTLYLVSFVLLIFLMGLGMLFNNEIPALIPNRSTTVSI